jgi:hypothetical protein
MQSLFLGAYRGLVKIDHFDGIQPLFLKRSRCSAVHESVVVVCEGTVASTIFPITRRSSAGGTGFNSK